MKSDLVEKAREYAKHDEYHVTRNYILALCLEIERLRSLNKDVFSKIQDNVEVFDDAERYRWLKTQAWDLPEEVVAPTVISCDGRGQNWTWLTGIMLDEAIDEFRKGNKYD
jgi:hypothetical protein